MKNLAEKCYESVREVLQKSGDAVPCWQETPEAFRIKFEAELLDGINKLRLVNPRSPDESKNQSWNNPHGGHLL